MLIRDVRTNERAARFSRHDFPLMRTTDIHYPDSRLPTTGHQSCLRCLDYVCPFCLGAKTIPATVHGYGFPHKFIVSTARGK
jgi:hypothetical protein